MTRQDYELIMGYFSTKNVNRRDLEASLDFENLTMRENVAKDVEKLFIDAGYKKSEAENAIEDFVRFVRVRSYSGEITWDEFIKKLRDLYLEESDFGIRVQRFSKETYWEVFFNHFDITDYEDGNSKLTLNHEYYSDTENEKAYDVLEKHGIYTEVESHILSQIGHKWETFSKSDVDEVISAIATIFATQYVDKSRVDIMKSAIEKITMTNADLVPEVGLRDYTITFTGGDMIDLRF